MNIQSLRLAVVAVFLARKVYPEDFTMEMIGEPAMEPAEVSKPGKHLCGTPGCVMGWAPVALGVSPALYQRLSFEFEKLAFNESYSTSSPLFGERWFLTDNTEKGAAARILYYLELEENTALCVSRWDENHPQSVDFFGSLDRQRFQSEADAYFPSLLSKYSKIVDEQYDFGEISKSLKQEYPGKCGETV